MPKTLFERVVFAILMVFIMVLAMEIYNQGQISGGLSWDDVPRAAHESAIMIPICFVMSFFIADPVAGRICSRNVPSEKDGKIVLIAFRAAVTVSMMCPLMSLWATLLFKRPDAVDFIPVWLTTVASNYPMAFFWQLMFCGPLVRFIFRILFSKPR